MFLRHVAVLILTLCFAQAAVAQNAPEIALRSDDELGEFKDTGLIVETLSVTANIRAGLAQISLAATLRNETENDIEASFAYPLPDNAIINHYALDIEGELVDGVLLPKERAEKLYTDRVTQSIDPGIAARTLDNRYKTRIYPIAPDGGRRSIQLGFSVPVPAEGLHLPFESDTPIERVTIQITGDGAQSAERPFETDTALNRQFSGGIFIPAAPAEAVISQYNDNAFLAVPLAANSQSQERAVKSVAVIWDSSLSRQSSDLARERRFVRDLITRLNPNTQSLSHGARQIDFTAEYNSPAALMAELDNIQYDGATNLSALLDSKASNDADVCLIITDGHSTFGRGEIPNLPCRVFTYSASKTSNTAWLSLVAARNAGANLTGLSAGDALTQITTQSEFQLAPGQAGEVFRFGGRVWFIAPITERQRQFKIKFQTHEKNIALRRLSKAPHPAAAAIWGQRQIAALQAYGPSRFDEIVAASRLWSVQSRETSFLVLESADEYVEAELTPPRNFPADRLEDYNDSLEDYQESQAEEREDHLEDIAELWSEQIAWWETEWSKKVWSNAVICWDGTTPEDVADCPVEPASSLSPQPIAPQPEAVPAPTPPGISGLNNGFADAVTDDCPDCDYVVVSGARRINPAGELPPDIAIALRPWSPDRPFLTALKELTGEAFETEYIRQREIHGERPSFYLEIADQLHRTGQSRRAAAMALTALDLPSLTSTTRSNVADRLLMYGETEIAIGLYRDVLPESQDRPQPYYNLALALIQAGDKAKRKERSKLYGEAFTHLVHVINNAWEDEYEGIHLIALQDLNRTLARLTKRERRKFEKALGLDKFFYRNLHTDIRVLVDWTAADADIDIHVIEGAHNDDEEEEAYFGNRGTERGGRVSNDMTEGYGPEEYLIRSAPNGLYRIESDYYAQDDYSEDGALNLRARIWRDFGRKSESFETVIIEMLEEKEDPYVLGEIHVGPKN